MADQVNHAFRTTYRNEDIIGIYNADSIPHPDSLSEVQECFTNKDIQVVQQRVIFFNQCSNSFFSRGYAIHQSLFEINENLFRDFAGRGRGVSGHGMFFKSTVFSNKIFPTEYFCEDIALSAELIARGTKIASVPVYELNEPPPSLSAIINQHYVWFNTTFQVFDLQRRARVLVESIRIIPLFLWCARRVLLNIAWLFGPIAILYSLTLAPWLLLPLIAYCLATSLLLYKFADKNMSLNFVLDSFALLVYLFIDNFGPIKYLFCWIASFAIPSLEITKYKTPR